MISDCQMGRRSFTPEFRREAVKRVRERGVSQAQAARDLGVHYNVLRKWVSDAKRDATRGSAGGGKQRTNKPR